MNDSEQLVQRFLDQELSAEERIRFVTRLGKDETLRRQVLELEQLSLDVSRLQRPQVPEGFVARVMDRTAPHQGALSILWAPHTLRWNLAGLAAAACLVLLAGAVLVRGVLSSTPAQPPQVVSSVPAHSPVLVRLVLLQPMATTVQVAGSFNDWSPTSTPLEQISNGAWTVTIPLNPGRYEYMFVVDGQQWIGDPFAAEQNDDGFGSQNAVLDVKPPAGAQS